MSDKAQNEQPLAHSAGFLDTLAVYADWRMAKILLIGVISGFPWVLIGSMMTLWLKEEGFTRTGIGVFGLVFTVYAFNMFWAPFVDNVRLPVLSRFGKRRSWIVLMQVFIAMLMIVMSQLSPAGGIAAISVVALLIAVFSATQDIAVDALRIELIGVGEQQKVGAGSAMATSGWWLGYGGFGAVALALADWFPEGGSAAWQKTYLALVLVIVLCVVLLLVFVKEGPAVSRARAKREDAKLMGGLLSGGGGAFQSVLGHPAARSGVLVLALFAALFAYPFLKGNVPESVSAAGGLAVFFFLLLWAVVAIAAAFVLLVIAGRAAGGADEGDAAIARIYSIWYMPVRNFIVRHGMRIGLTVLALVFLFKVGEAFLGRMSLVFYREIGFSKSDIALYSKGYGTIAIIIFAVIGSLINARYGLFRGLLIGGIAMASTNLLFAVLAFYPEKWLFATAVVADQFTTAVSTVALVAFLSQLCDRRYTATQYAAFASIGNFSRTTLAAGSGVLVDSLGGNWSLFFVLTTLMVIPSLALLLHVRRDIAPYLRRPTTKQL